MVKQLKQRLPLLVMTLLMTAWISYGYLTFVQADINFGGAILYGLVVVFLAELITWNRWSALITGGLGVLHVLCSFVEIPGLHDLATTINECAIDTYEKVFWTDRHFFVNEGGTVFLVFFAVGISIYLLYVKAKSVGFTIWLLMLYIFFMEFFNVAETWLLVTCLVHMLLALLVLYGCEWYGKAESAKKRPISLKYGIPLLSLVLAISMLFTLTVEPTPNREFQSWLNHKLEGMWTPPEGVRIPPRFSQSIFEKNGTFGGSVSFQGEYLFSVMAYTNTGEQLSDDRLYLRGIACDYFENEVWQTAIDTGDDKRLDDYFDDNLYFCGSGLDSFITESLEKNNDLFQGCNFKVKYDEASSDTLFNHTYTTGITAYGEKKERVYYDYSTYTYHKGKVNEYNVSYLALDRNSDSMQQFLQDYSGMTFALYSRLDSQTRKQIEAYYLQMPEDITDAVKALADRITATYPGDYEKAAAIEYYLKNNYTYTLEPGTPPKERNLVEYFLFDSKKGYCSYYASAMVMLCRSIGIPARYVKGYRLDDVVNGTWNEVLDINAHAWVEVFIPQLGWVTFDPVGYVDFAQNNPEYKDPDKPSTSPTPTPPPTPSPTPTPADSVTETPTDTVTPTPTPTTETPTLPPTSTVTQAPVSPTPTTTGTISPVKDGNSAVWWILGILGIVLLAGLLLLLMLKRNKKQPVLTEREVLQRAPLQIYKRLLRVKTFMGLPQETGETISQYLKRIQNPKLEDMAAVFEACFYNQAVLTKKQYQALKNILRQEETAAVKEKGNIKWFWFRLKYRA